MFRQNPTRRSMLAMGVAVVNAITAGLLATPCVGFLLSPLLRRRTSTWASLGSASQFQADLPRPVRFHYRDQSDFVERDVRRIAFVLRDGGEWIVMSATCTHMGCNVAFSAQSNTFECPCHGGRYDRTGSVISGPPPKPLSRFQTRVVNGDLEIKVT